MFIKMNYEKNPFRYNKPQIGKVVEYGFQLGHQKYMAPVRYGFNQRYAGGESKKNPVNRNLFDKNYSGKVEEEID